jgi:hypothetical protein
VIAPSPDMQPLSLTQLAVIVLVSVVAMDVIRRFIQAKLERKGLPLPPGPTPIQICVQSTLENETVHGACYLWWTSYPVSVMLNTPQGTYFVADFCIVVLGSHSRAMQLLEKRSRLYSDRPFVATLEQ